MSSIAKKNLTFTEKQERNLLKKAKKEEERFLKTGDERHQLKCQKLNEEVERVKNNVETDKKIAVEKKKIEQKSDDQLINEAIRQNRREKNNTVVKVDKKTISEAERAELKQKIKGKKPLSTKDMKKMNDTMKEMEKAKEVAIRDVFAKDYLEKFPDSSESNVQKEFVKHKQALELGGKIKFYYVQNICNMTGRDEEEVLEEYTKINEEFREQKKGLLERDIIELLEEECNILLLECNCRIKFVEEVIKMSGGSKDEIEMEYDEDYTKFTSYANENGYTKKVAVDKYVDICNKKLQVANFRYMIVNKIVEEKGLTVEEANSQFDEMMEVMNRPGEDGEGEEDIDGEDTEWRCMPACNEEGCNDPKCVKV